MLERIHGVGDAPLSFGPFTLTDVPRSLFFAGQEVPLDRLSLDILAVLAERRDDLVDSAELIARIDSEAPLDEAGLLGRIAAINPVLEHSSPAGCYIAHYPNEGFVLVVPGAAAERRPQRLPSRLTSIIGRDGAIEQVIARVRRRRFVTIVGTGGIGKTTVALAVAQALEASFKDGVCFVDLSSLAEPGFVAGTVASALGFADGAGGALSGLTVRLRNKNILVVLDSCEHVIAEAARVGQAMVECGAQVAVLATSREPLRASGECLERLRPMRLPASGVAMSAADALSYSAIELFVERARAAKADFELEDRETALATALCRRLDGIPLAIEIVAARVAELGVHGLAEQVERRMLELAGRRRSAPVRHHTISALLDWSYESLSERQRRVFQRLSLFRGSFSGDAAAAVVVDPEMDRAQADAGMRDLVRKSLVARTTSEQGVAYRLLDTTRAYASRKLDGSGERKRVSARHAGHLLAVLRGAEVDWEQMSRRGWLARYARWIDDVRGALDWAFATDGDASIGIALTMASFALVRQMGLDAEFRTRLEEALAMLAGVSSPSQHQLEADRGTTRSREALLVAALERTTWHEEPAVAARHRVAFLSGVWVSAIMRADYPAAARLSARIGRIARVACDPVATMISMRMRAQSLHFMGHHRTAGTLAQQLLEQAPLKIPLGYNPSPIEPRVWMRIILARILWLQGSAEQAAAMARECVRHARTNTPLAQCQALALAAIPIALWSGRGAACDEFVELLREIAGVHAFAQWQPWADRYRDVLSLRRLPQGAREVAQLARPHWSDANLQDHLCTVDARFVLPAEVDRVTSGMAGWCAPEVLRVHGEQTLTQSFEDATASGEASLLRSLAVARRQRALSWELRTAASLARLWKSQRRAKHAYDLLAPIHARFSEGFETPDWLAAAALLSELKP